MKMKSLIFAMTLLISTLVSCGGSANMNYDEVLANVEETENYEVMELARMDPNLSTFVQLVDLSGLDFSMEFADSYTVLIPTNEAFEKLSVNRVKELSNPANRTELVRLVRRHFLPTEVALMEFNETQIIETSGEEEITVATQGVGNSVTVGGAQIRKSNIQAADGMVHIVDAVIQPTENVVAQ